MHILESQTTIASLALLFVRLVRLRYLRFILPLQAKISSITVTLSFSFSITLPIPIAAPRAKHEQE